MSNLSFAALRYMMQKWNTVAQFFTSANHSKVLILCWKHDGCQLYDSWVCVTFPKDLLNVYVDICQRNSWWFFMYLNRAVQWTIVSSAINGKKIGLESMVTLMNNGHWPVDDVSYLFYVLWFLMWYSLWTCIYRSAKPLIKQQQKMLSDTSERPLQDISAIAINYRQWTQIVLDVKPLVPPFPMSVFPLNAHFPQ